MERPLVTVICLCYNHVRFLERALDSVFSQSYPSIELIVVDDASSDDSPVLIHRLLIDRPEVKVIALQKNVGNCKAFNMALANATGKYVVDLSADDVFASHRIEKQVALFESLGPEYGVVFTDAQFIDEQNEPLDTFYARLIRRKLITRIPQGDVYVDVLRRYFISAPTMLVRREVFDELKGYDENLAYEDFDFWVRSARLFKYAFIDERLTFVRKTKDSLSTKLYQPGDKQLYSTYIVCEKAFALNRTQEEMLALAERIRYELRHAVLTKNMKEAQLFYDLLGRVDSPRWLDKTLMRVGRSAVSVKGLRRWMLK